MHENKRSNSSSCSKGSKKHYTLKEPHFPQIYLAHTKGKTVTIAILIKVGSEDDNLGKFGQAHVVEHFVFHGTQRRPSLKALFSPFISLGAKINAETSREHTIYYCTVLSSDLKEACQLLFEMIKQPLLDPKYVSFAKHSATNELFAGKSNPSDYIIHHILVPELLRTLGIRKSHSTAGLAEDIQSITYSDLFEFYCKYYTHPKKNIVISVYGNLTSLCAEGKNRTPTRNEFSRLAEYLLDTWHSFPYLQCRVSKLKKKKKNLFSSLEKKEKKTLSNKEKASRKSGKNSLNSDFSMNPQPTKNFPPLLLVERKKMEESYISVGWKMDIREKSFQEINQLKVTLRWISDYLTGGFISKLYLKLRYENKYIYSVSSSQETFRECILLIVNCATFETQKIQQIIQIIVDETDKIKFFSNSLEFIRWTSWLRQDNSMSATSTKETSIRNAIELARYGKVTHAAKMVSFIDKIKESHIRDTAQLVFSTKPIIAVLQGQNYKKNN